MDPATFVNVDFIDVKWSGLGQPNNFTRRVKMNFLLDNDGKFFEHNDMHDILAAWLCDEFNLYPIDFNFIIAP